jgi:hypothetical protein
MIDNDDFEDFLLVNEPETLLGTKKMNIFPLFPNKEYYIKYLNRKGKVVEFTFVLPKERHWEPMNGIFKFKTTNGKFYTIHLDNIIDFYAVAKPKPKSKTQSGELSGVELFWGVVCFIMLLMLFSSC